MAYKNKTLIFLTLITIFGALLRFYRLGEIPALYVDEAAIGYNTYSMLLTGADEYGKALPVFIRSFSAYSSPLYVYLSMIPVWFFGISSFSVRFLSAFVGVFTIPMIFLILEKFFDKKRSVAPILGTIVFALSPWHIFFSRAAFEANLALLLLSIAIYVFLKAAEKNKYYILGVVILAVSTYAYHSSRLIPFIFLPLYSVLLVKSKKLPINILVTSASLFFVIVIPQVLLVSTPAFGSRAEGLFYANLTTPYALFREFLSQFVAYFSPKNIFFLGDSDLQRSIPEMGLFYSWILLFYLIGFLVFFRNLKKTNFIFLGIMLLSFTVPAALARDPFSSLRALPLIIPFVIITSLGIDFVVVKIGAKLTVVGTIFLSIVSLFFFWRGYFVLFAHERATIWGFGYKELSEIVKNSNEHFIIDTSRIKPPHVLLSFYIPVPPKEYQQFARTKIINGYYSDLDFDSYYKLRNFETRVIDWERDVYKEQVLVGDLLAISEEQAKEHYLEEVFKIYDPLDQLVFQGLRTNPEEKCRMINNTNELCK